MNRKIKIYKYKSNLSHNYSYNNKSILKITEKNVKQILITQMRCKFQKKLKSSKNKNHKKQFNLIKTNNN